MAYGIDPTTELQVLKLVDEDRRADRLRSFDEYISEFPRQSWKTVAATLIDLESGASEEEAPDKALIGPYRLGKEIGKGGQATVYLAQDERINRRVAIKVFHTPAGEELPQSLRVEAEAAGGLEHPAICRILDLDVDQIGRPYVAMRYVEGRTFELAFLEECSFALDDRDRILRIFVALLGGVAFAHERGVIHRDISPRNVILQDDDHPVLLDFGLAKIVDGRPSLSRGAVIGTPAYVAPELHRGEGAGSTVDVYAVGVLLFEALSGTRLHAAKTEDALRRSILRGPNLAAKREMASWPRDLRRVVETSLALEPELRYRRAADFRDDLSAFLERRPIQAVSVPWPTRFGLWCRRNRLFVLVAAVVFCALVAALVATLAPKTPNAWPRTRRRRGFEPRLTRSARSGCGPRPKRKHRSLRDGPIVRPFCAARIRRESEDVGARLWSISSAPRPQDSRMKLRWSYVVSAFWFCSSEKGRPSVGSLHFRGRFMPTMTADPTSSSFAAGASVIEVSTSMPDSTIYAKP